MENQEIISGIQAALNAGLSMAGDSLTGKTPTVMVPQGARFEAHEELLDNPTRKRANVKLRDVASFTGYVDAEKTGSTRLYGSKNPPSFTAVFNDHGAEPGWRDYKASYLCPLSAEWKTWTGKSGAHMSQEQFAQFIEDNLPDIAMPPAADMLEISRSLEAKKKVNFASGIRLSNGQNELTYEEEITGTAQKGKLQVPEEFTIGIPVLEGGIGYAVACRLRYRIGEGGKLAMWYEIVRAHKTLEDAANEVWSEIEVATELVIFNGSPE